MKKAELVAELERREREAAKFHSFAPLANTYRELRGEVEALEDVAPGKVTPEEMYTTAQVAKLYKVHQKTASAWAKDGKWPGTIRHGTRGEWRIPARAVHDDLHHQQIASSHTEERDDEKEIGHEHEGAAPIPLVAGRRSGVRRRLSERIHGGR